MEHITETQIRASFVNCSKGEARRLSVPRDLEELPWADLDFLGWRDPGAPDRAYLVARHDGELLGLSMRAAGGASRGFTARSMCSLCLTTHTSGGVALMSARRTGEPGRQGNTVGKYLCADLACSLYVRGKRQASAGKGFDETLTPAEKIARLLANLSGFVGTVLD